MTDIVERLREWAEQLERDGYHTAPPMMREATDEIERLRAQRTFEGRMDDAWRSGYRNAVLEEAAKVADKYAGRPWGDDRSEDIAIDIRALKGGE